MANLPNSDLVAISWLKSLPALPTDSVSGTLPGDNASWSATGFVQVTSIPGIPGMHVPLQNPVIQVDCWANNVNSSKPPWGKAGHLAQAVYLASVAFERPVEPLLPGDFETARILSVYPMTEPRRIEGDEAGFARYSIEICVVWAVMV